MNKKTARKAFMFGAGVLLTIAVWGQGVRKNLATLPKVFTTVDNFISGK